MSNKFALAVRSGLERPAAGKSIYKSTSAELAGSVSCFSVAKKMVMLDGVREREGERERDSLVRGDVEEEIGELGRGVLGAMGRGEARNEHHWLPGKIVLALPEKGHAVVRYQVRVIVLVVLEAVLYLLSVHVHAVVVIARIHY